MKNFNDIFIIPRYEHSSTEPFKRKTNIMEDFDRITDNVMYLKLLISEIRNDFRDRRLQTMKDELKMFGYETKVMDEIACYEYNQDVYQIWILVHKQA